MKPIPVLPTLCPKAQANLANSVRSTRAITNLDGLAYDQTYLHHNGRMWEVYRHDKSPRLVGRFPTINIAILKARMRMPWYMQ